MGVALNAGKPRLLFPLISGRYAIDSVNKRRCRRLGAANWLIWLRATTANSSDYRSPSGATVAGHKQYLLVDCVCTHLEHESIRRHSVVQRSSFFHHHQCVHARHSWTRSWTKKASSLPRYGIAVDWCWSVHVSATYTDYSCVTSVQFNTAAPVCPTAFDKFIYDLASVANNLQSETEQEMDGWTDQLI